MNFWYIVGGFAVVLLMLGIAFAVMWKNPTDDPLDYDKNWYKKDRDA